MLKSNEDLIRRRNYGVVMWLSANLRDDARCFLIGCLDEYVAHLEVFDFLQPAGYLSLIEN